MQDTTIETHADVSVPAIVGGVLGCLSPLAFCSRFFWFIPFTAVVVIAVGWVQMRIHRARMVGDRLAFIGLCLSLIFGAAGVVAQRTLEYHQREAGKYFARQWFDLMLEGRDMEALQLDKMPLQRARGAGIWRRYTTGKEEVDAYAMFRKNAAVQVLLNEFQGGEVRFLHTHSAMKVKKVKTFAFAFEVAKGEGLMRKSREFEIQVAANEVASEPRIDWVFKAISPIPSDD